MKVAVDIKNLTQDYDSVVVLNDLSFSVMKGEFFILIGPNGSGKTTLMKTMAGILKLRKGTLEIMGRPIGSFKQKELARHLAFVPQQLPEDIPFSVMEVLLMGRFPHLGLLGLEGKDDMDIVENAMKFTNTSHLSMRRLSQLSGGELQRVYIARALCQEPDIILLDEPTAFLDLAHQIQIMDLLENLKKEKGVTVIMVSHDVNLAAMYGDRLILMKDGGAVKQGMPEEVLTFSALEKTYGCVLLVDKSSLGKFPRVTPVPKKFINMIDRQKSGMS
ncbi:ABC transporter ATP-binding protein [Desulfobacterales bacterium HSG16]|nr:ABC transporter ATP-binding protein [Desulfobacterales bacterium HSG16]